MVRNYGQRKCKWCGNYGGGHDCRRPGCLPQDCRDALLRFKRENGYRWKSKLRVCWEASNYPGFEDIAALLQQARNTYLGCLDAVK